MNLREDMHIVGNGAAGGFATGAHWPVPINDFAAGDLDGDGLPDLVAAANYPGGLLWRNQGDGSFLAVEHLPGSPFGSRCVVLFDADGDGDLDAFFGGGRTSYEGAGPCSLLRNDGFGILSVSSTVPQDVSGADDHIVFDVGVGDLDGDGDLDVVLFTRSNPRIRVWRNDGTGTFTEVTTSAFPNGQVPTLTERGAVTDIDGDGDLDLLHGELYRNDGAGVFAHDPTFAAVAGRAADLDGDGDLDLIDAGQVRINDGLGNFTAAGSLPPAPPFDPNLVLFDTNRIWAVDVDGDGRRDLVGAFWSSTPTLLRNTGGFVYQDVTDTWFEPHARQRGVVDSYWTASLAFDADGDGRVDLVTGGTEGRNAPVSTTVGVPPRLFVNAGCRLVDAGRPAFPFLQTCASAIASGDLDGDGDVDLVLGYDFYYFPSTQGCVFLQDDAGRFAAIASPTFGPGTTRLADFDGDGDLDALALTGAGPLWPGGWPGRHRLLLNDGAGNFTDVTATHMPVTASSGGAGCAVGDIDGDGDLDAVIGSYDPVDWWANGEPLILLRNDGTGVFTDVSAWLPPTLCQGAAVDLADFDGDQDLDLVVGSDGYHRLVDAGGNQIDSMFLFRNDGTGHFTDVSVQSLPSGLFGDYRIRDVDGDGDLDLLVADRDLINDGTGTFTSSYPPTGTGPDLDEDGLADDPTAFAQQNGAEHLVVHTVDLDRDGDLDAVIGPVMAFGNRYWNQLRVEVLYNLRRDLRVATLPRLGQPCRLHLRAGNGGAATVVLPALSIGRLPQPVPGLGLLVLDPATIMLLPFATVPDPDTTVEVAVGIPNDPQFLGLPLTCQALFGNGPLGQPASLSNAMTYAIEN